MCVPAGVTVVLLSVAWCYACGTVDVTVVRIFMVCFLSCSPFLFLRLVFCCTRLFLAKEVVVVSRVALKATAVSLALAFAILCPAFALNLFLFMCDLHPSIGACPPS